MSNITIQDRTQKVDLVMTSGTVLKSFSIAAIPALVRNGNLFKEIKGSVIAWDGEKEIRITGVDVVKALTGTLKPSEIETATSQSTTKPEVNEPATPVAEEPKAKTQTLPPMKVKPQPYQRATDYNPDQKIEVLKNGKTVKITLREWLTLEKTVPGKKPVAYSCTLNSKATFSINGNAFEISGGNLMNLLNDLKIANIRQETVFNDTHNTYDNFLQNKKAKLTAKQKKQALAQRNLAVATSWESFDKSEDYLIGAAIVISGIQKPANEPKVQAAAPTTGASAKDKLPQPTPGQPAFTATQPEPGVRESLALLRKAIKRHGKFAVSEIKRVAKEYAVFPEPAQNSTIVKIGGALGRIGGLVFGSALKTFSKAVRAARSYMDKTNEPSLSAIRTTTGVPPVLETPKAETAPSALEEKKSGSFFGKTCKVAAAGAVGVMIGLAINHYGIVEKNQEKTSQLFPKAPPITTAATTPSINVLGLPVAITPATTINNAVNAEPFALEDPAPTATIVPENITKAIVPVIVSHGAFIDFLRAQSGNPTATVIQQ